MAKSVRRKKQDRRQRQHRAADEARRREREAQQAAVLARARQLLESLRSPDTPVSEVAAAIVELWAEDPPRMSILGTVVEGEPERLAAIAAAVAQISPGSLGSRVLAIELAGLVHGDVKAAVSMIDEVLGEHAGRDEAWRRTVLGHRMVALGEPLRAFRIAQAELAGLTEPDSAAGEGDEVDNDTETAIEAVQILQQAAVEDAAAGTDGGDGMATMAAFTDRAALTGLETAIATWLGGQGDADPEWLEEELADLLPEDAGDVLPTEAVRGIMRCVGLVKPDAEDDADDLDDDDLDDDDLDDASHPSLVTQFAQDPATPAELAVLAARWDQTIHFGLWRVDDSVGEDPGAELVDLVSNVRRYVPTASLGDRPPARWSVLLGALVCVDGVWRPATPMMPLSPVEGDALTELANDAAEVVIGALTGRRGRSPARRRAPFGAAPPHGVFADDTEPAPISMSRLLSTIAATLFAEMVLEVAGYRSAVPRLRNTDGDPLIMVRAALTVDDLDGAVARLTTHPDITVDDETGELGWWGRELTPAELASSTAQLAAETGVEIELDEDHVQRWLRGRVTVDGTLLRLEVNSQQRLERFCGLLRDLGADPRIVERITVDPEQDMVLPRGPLLPAPRAPEVDAAWAKHWLDEKVPALNGRTPRQAARSDRERPLLEALLRKFEWDDDMRAQGDHGLRSGNTAWIREQLDLA